MEVGETTEAGRNRDIGDRPIALQNKLSRSSQAQLKVVTMTYVSPKTGKQYIVITAGGARQSTDRGDYVMAYALP